MRQVDLRTSFLYHDIFVMAVDEQLSKSSYDGFFVYMVKCSDGTLYTGWTTNLFRRITAHNTAITGAKYTKARRPVTLVYAERFLSKRAAMSREAHIKKMGRNEKLRLIGWKV